MWTAIVGMFAAVIGFLGVVVGAVVTGFVTLRQARLATQREHDVRKIEWEQARKGVRDAFQRQSLLAVQDAVEDARRATVREWDRLLIWARVFDSELRDLLEGFCEASSATIGARQARELVEQMDTTNKLARRVEDRIGILLPSLY